MRLPGTRSSVATFLAVLALAVLLHHAGGASMDQGESMDHGMGAGQHGAAITLCLAVVGLGAAGLVLARASTRPGTRPWPSRAACTGGSWIALRQPLVRTRAGPLAILQVFRL